MANGNGPKTFRQKIEGMPKWLRSAVYLATLVSSVTLILTGARESGFIAWGAPKIDVATVTMLSRVDSTARHADSLALRAIAVIDTLIHAQPKQAKLIARRDLREAFGAGYLTEIEYERLRRHLAEDVLSPDSVQSLLDQIYAGGHK